MEGVGRLRWSQETALADHPHQVSDHKKRSALYCSQSIPGHYDQRLNFAGFGGREGIALHLQTFDLLLWAFNISISHINYQYINTF